MASPLDLLPVDRDGADAAAAYGLALTQFSGGNAVGLLRGGDEFFPTLIEAVSQARREV